jgi:hypothetical protein
MVLAANNGTIQTRGFGLTSFNWSMVQCVRMGDRESSESDLNDWDCEGRKAGGQTKKKPICGS